MKLLKVRGLFILLLCCVCGSGRADLVLISIPDTLAFNVTDVSQATMGAPNPFVLSFTGLAIPGVDKFYISVKANAANFTPPSGTAIPASNVSWTASASVGGAGFSGTLSSTSWNAIYQSNLLATLGHVNIVWQLAPPPSGIRAGNHTLVITYKLAAF